MDKKKVIAIMMLAVAGIVAYYMFFMGGAAKLGIGLGTKPDMRDPRQLLPKPDLRDPNLSLPKPDMRTSKPLMGDIPGGTITSLSTEGNGFIVLESTPVFSGNNILSA